MGYFDCKLGIGMPRSSATDITAQAQPCASASVFMPLGQGGLSLGFQFADRTRIPYAIEAGDLNGDGRPDVVIGYISAPGAVFFNDGNGRQFTEVRFGDGQGAAYGFALGDLNGDRYPDVAQARSGAPNVMYLSER